jgi:TPR repeat protein
MANLGALYQMGAGGQRNNRRAYAWLRVALAFGVPAKDHDATVFRLGMIAARIGPANTARAERLAGEFAEKITQQCQIPADRNPDWALEANNH